MHSTHISFFAIALFSGLVSLSTGVDAREGHWHHPRGHVAESLFRRQANVSTPLPAVGSPEWQSRFPRLPFRDPPIPDAWMAAYNDAVAANLIPSLPIPVVGVFPIYPNGTDPSAATVCSASYNCRGQYDVWDAPDGVVGISFDDGPLEASPKLYDFLKNAGQKATHFYIGTNILESPKVFLKAFEGGDDIAVHTYTHPYMTTLPNLQILAELGWTMQVIHDSTGGRIPKYWRPPYGDVDNRVRAIARHVFGLTTIIWNRDALDWELGTKYMTPERVHQNLTTWYTGPKSPGLIILEHELSTESVQAFIDAYPLIKSNGWEARSVAELLGGPAYLNAVNDTGAVVEMGVGQDVGMVLAGQSRAAAATGGMEPGATQVVQVSAGVSGLRTTAAPTASSSSSSSPSKNAGSSSRTGASLLLLLLLPVLFA